jgi:hypothetical protein
MVQAVHEDLNDTPENGNLSFCFTCGAFAIFDDAFEDRARKPTPAENFEIKHDKDLQQLLIVWERLGRKNT